MQSLDRLEAKFLCIVYPYLLWYYMDDAYNNYINALNYVLQFIIKLIINWIDEIQLIFIDCKSILILKWVLNIDHTT